MQKQRAEQKDLYVLTELENNFILYMSVSEHILIKFLLLNPSLWAEQL